MANSNTIKKRTIVAIIITIVALFLTNKYWLTYRPLSVNFDIEGKGKYNIEAQFNKKDNDEFVKIKSNAIFVNLNENAHIDIFVERVKQANRFRMILTDSSNATAPLAPPPLILSNVKFREGKYNLNDIEKFKVEGASAKTKDNKLIITPKNQTIILTYPETIKVKAGVSFKFFIFSIILILSYLFSYKLSDYVADFKNVKGKSRIEITFLCIFFVFLFIPMMHTNQENISERENRYLAEWKPLISINNEINYSFGNDFNEWFNDRFNLRNFFIWANSLIKIKLNNIYQTPKATYDKKFNLLYTNGFHGIKNKVNEKDLKTIANNINALNKYCKKNNIKLYILVVPRKSDFCKHTVLNNEIEKKDYAKDIIDEIKNNTEIKIVYPKQEMLEANQITPVYFKTDHHWTKKGAFIGYAALLNEIKKDFPLVKLLKESDLTTYYDKMVSEHWDKQMNFGQTFYLIGFPKIIAKKLLDTNYIYYKNPYKKFLKRYTLKKAGFTNANNGLEDDYFYYPYGSDLKVLIIGNSFARNLVEFVPYSFKHTVRFKDNYGIDRNLNMQYYIPFIKEYKPDIMILNFHTASLEILLNLDPKEYTNSHNLFNIK